MPGPLDGIRVIDLTAIISGPMATQVLADQGADVIKIEPPGGGDLMRYMGTQSNGVSAMFATTNRNKRSVVLDLKQQSGIDLLKQLVHTADVFVQNFRPGAVERMGLGFDVLASLNPMLVYVSITGFGRDGPYAQQRVYDAVVQGVAGFAATQGGPNGRGPELVRSIICDKVTAITAAQAITAALLARERRGTGQHVELSMLDASLSFLWPDSMWNHTFLSDDATRLPPLADMYRIVATADGHVIMNVVSDREYQGLCRSLQREDLIDDSRFAAMDARVRHAAELAGIIENESIKFSTAELCASLEREHVPGARVNALDDIARDPQVRHSGCLLESRHPVAGLIRQPRPAACFDGTPAENLRASPALGEHTDEVLGELGLGAAARAGLRESGVIE